MRIRMLETVKPFLFLDAKPDTFLLCGEEYEAVSNRLGAISGICENGEKLGVKPGEFEFVGAVPGYIYDIWADGCPAALRSAERVD